MLETVAEPVVAAAAEPAAGPLEVVAAESVFAVEDSVATATQSSPACPWGRALQPSSSSSQRYWGKEHASRSVPAPQPAVGFGIAAAVGVAASPAFALVAAERLRRLDSPQQRLSCCSHSIVG